MAAGSFNILARLGLSTTSFNRGLRRSKKQLTTFGKAVQGVGNMLKGMLAGFAVGAVVGAFKNLVTTAVDFENAMARVKVISQATSSELADMEANARMLGATTRFTAMESAQGLQFLTMAGLSTAQANETLASTLDLAGAAMVDVGYAADVTTNLLSGFNLATSESDHVVDLLAHTTRSANTNLEELYDGMKEAAPMATQLGISMDEVATTMALFANSGIKGQRAGVGFSGVLARLLRQPKEVAESLAELGVTINEATIAQDGFIGTMHKLNQAGITATQMTKIFGLHVKTVGIFAQKSGAEMEIMRHIVENYNDAAEHMSKEGIGKTAEAIKLLGSAWAEVEIAFAQGGLLETITNFLKTSKKILNYWEEIATVIRYLPGHSQIVDAWEGLDWLTSLLSGEDGTVAKLSDYKTVTDELIGDIDSFSDSTLTAAEAQEKLNKKLKEFRDLSDEDKSKIIDELSGDFRAEAEQLEYVFAKVKKQAEEYREQGLNPKTFMGEEFLRQGIDAWEEFWQVLDKIDRLGGDTSDFRKRWEKVVKDTPKITQNTSDKGYLVSLMGTEEELREHLDKQKNEVFDFIDEVEERGDNAILKALFGGTQEGVNTSNLVDWEKHIAASTKALETQKQAFIGYNEALEDYNSIIGEINDFAMSGLADSIYELGNALSHLDFFNKGLDEDITKWIKFGQTVTREIQNISSIATQALALQQSQQDAKDALSSRAIAAGISETAVNAGKHTSAIPFGFLAVPGVIASVLAMFSALPKFESGGIIGGNSFKGDNIMARVNSGEMILNGNQQANLFRMANGGLNGQMREVEFKIKGDTLVGAINNSRVKRSKFS